MKTKIVVKNVQGRMGEIRGGVGTGGFDCIVRKTVTNFTTAFATYHVLLCSRMTIARTSIALLTIDNHKLQQE